MIYACCRLSGTFRWMKGNLTYLLHGEVLPEQLTGLQLVKKFPAFHGTRRFITALTSVRHLLRDASPGNTPPPGEPNGGVFYLRIVLSPEQASHLWMFLNNVFYREGLLAPRPTPNLEDHPSSAVRDCLLNLFAATLLIGSRSSNRILTYLPFNNNNNNNNNIIIIIINWNWVVTRWQ